MKYFLLLMVIVLISLCTGIPNLPFLNNNPIQTGTPGIEASNEDIYINANALPSEISGGNDVILYFQIMNKANYDLENVILTIYDPCVNDEAKVEVFNIEKLKSNQTLSKSVTLNSIPITLTRDCQVKFNLDYKGKFTYYQDVVVLSQSEYNTRLLQGTLKNIPISSSFTSSPLKISPSFTEEQPLLNGTSYDMQINYAYTGNGFINVSSGDVIITVPSNLEVSPVACRGDYSNPPIEGKMTLSNGLKFINKKVSPSTCTFTAKASQPIDIKSLAITANYVYTIDSSVPVRVKGTSPSQTSTGTSGGT